MKWLWSRNHWRRRGKLEGVVSQQVVVILVVPVVWDPGVACHEMHEDRLHDVVGLLHGGHGPRRSVSL